MESEKIDGSGPVFALSDVKAQGYDLSILVKKGGYGRL